jgi:hypothetical protein
MEKEQEKKETPLDLTKTVPIDAQEEEKLKQFLKRMQEGIQGDAELEDMLGGTIDKWSKELNVKEPEKR